MSAASGDRVTTRPTRDNASENNAQAGPVRLIWFDIYPPSQQLEPGIEVSAPLLSFPPLPPLSRSSSRTSSSALHSFPATPCIPGSTLPNFTTAIPQDAGQDNLQVPDGDWSTSPLYMSGPEMAFPSEIATGIAMPSAPEHQSSQMCNPGGGLYVPPQLHLSQGCNSTGSSCVPTQASPNPLQDHTTIISNRDLQVPATTSLPELPESYQFTFTAEPQLTMPNPSCLDPTDDHYLQPSFYPLASDFAWNAGSDHLVSTSTDYGQNENLGMTTQQEQDIGPAAGFEMDVMFPNFTQQAPGNGISTNNDNSWMDDILEEWGSIPSPPDSASQLQQTADLSTAGQSTAPAPVPKAQLKRTRDESEGGATGEVTEAPEPTNQKRTKTTGGSRHTPLTDRRHGVRGVSFFIALLVGCSTNSSICRRIRSRETPVVNAAVM